MKVLVTVSPCPSDQVKGTRSSLAPDASSYDGAAALQIAKWLGAASLPSAVKPVCSRYRES